MRKHIVPFLFALIFAVLLNPSIAQDAEATEVPTCDFLPEIQAEYQLQVEGNAVTVQLSSNSFIRLESDCRLGYLTNLSFETGIDTYEVFLLYQPPYNSDPIVAHVEGLAGEPHVIGLVAEEIFLLWVDNAGVLDVYAIYPGSNQAALVGGLTYDPHLTNSWGDCFTLSSRDGTFEDSYCAFEIINGDPAFKYMFISIN